MRKCESVYLYFVAMRWRMDDTYAAAHSVKDTVGDFDDVSDAFPQRGEVSLVAQADLIPLHQPHIWDRWKTRELDDALHPK